MLAPGVDPDDCRCLDFVAYGATQLGEALCCDVILFSALPPKGVRNSARRPRTVLPLLLQNAASALRTPSYSGEDGREVVRASVRDRGVALERRVAPTRRPALLPACPASPSSATGTCHPGLVQAVVGPANSGCAKHACYPSPPPCLARRHHVCRSVRLCPAASRLAEPLQPQRNSVDHRCPGTARGWP